MERRCPVCKRIIPQDKILKTAPFCSQRCKMVDLGNWLDEGYRIPAQDDELFSEDVEHSGSPDQFERN